MGRRRSDGIVLTVAAAIPQAAFAQGEGDEGGSRISESRTSELPPPVLGRRVYVEGVSVSRDRVNVSVRAATDISLKVRGYGGEGRAEPSATPAWHPLMRSETRDVQHAAQRRQPVRDSLMGRFSLGQAGAFSLSGDQIPYPLPSVDGDLCDAELTSLAWSRTAVSGTVSTDCEPSGHGDPGIADRLGSRFVEGSGRLGRPQVTGIIGRVTVEVGSRNGDRCASCP